LFGIGYRSGQKGTFQTLQERLQRTGRAVVTIFESSGESVFGILGQFTHLKFSPDGRFLGVSDEERAFFFDLEAIAGHLDLLGLRWETH